MKDRLFRFGKFLYLAFGLILFFNIFISTELPWKAKFSVFGVPANSWPGGDSRNIQMAAYCQSMKELVNDAGCLREAAPVKGLYSEATIPALNYPSMVVDIYGYFSNQTEEFFMAFWRLNALLLTVALFFLCWTYDFKSFPLLIFNPVLLLAIERGNTDALLFSLIFIPLLIFKSNALRVFFLGLATSLKIFPVFAYVAWSWLCRKRNLNSVLLGVGFSLPLVIASLIQLQNIIANTPKGFGYAYGFLSLLYIPTSKLPIFISGFYMELVAIILGCFVIFSAWVLKWMLRDWAGKSHFDKNIMKLNSIDSILLVVSLMIFLSTFLFSVSYAYRLIFIIPIFLVLSKFDGLFASLLRQLILLILWVPVMLMDFYLCYIFQHQSFQYLSQVFIWNW